MWIDHDTKFNAKMMLDDAVAVTAEALNRPSQTMNRTQLCVRVQLPAVVEQGRAFAHFGTETRETVTDATLCADVVQGFSSSCRFGPLAVELNAAVDRLRCAPQTDLPHEGMPDDADEGADRANIEDATSDAVADSQNSRDESRCDDGCDAPES
jgi:hypothetical protein